MKKLVLALINITLTVGLAVVIALVGISTFSTAITVTTEYANNLNDYATAVATLSNN